MILIGAFAATRLREPKPAADEITLCDVDSSRLCLIAFGANSPDKMAIAFQLPETGFPPFYVKASSRGNVNIYPCEAIASLPLNIYCSGTRTALGEYIDVEVYTIGDDVLIARGRFILSAFVRATAINSGGAGTTPVPGTAYPNP